ncbi:MAG TPA: SDR family NAD(P)-dependent oxidoreductase [Dehalococcoidia bacterium]|nr:SDR family NAD(P)-dependent oxidoreductase [Dehalococcoidia bacterium]
MGMLDGRTAIVTAAAGAGIGQAVARIFLDEGAQVVISDAHGRRALEMGEKLGEEFGREVPALEVDVRNVEQVAGMVQTARERFGRIDILFNNAGINKLSPVRDMDDETWRMVIDVNLTGTFNTTRAVLPAMIEQGSGSIINMSSSAGWIGSRDGESHYCAAKAGVMAFTRAVAAEVGQHGIRVNAIAPGLIYNEFLSRIYPPEFFERARRGIPLGRVGEPPDVARLALFLASDLSGYITGEVVCISGGAIMHA